MPPTLYSHADGSYQWVDGTFTDGDVADSNAAMAAAQAPQTAQEAFVSWAQSVGATIVPAA